MYDNNTYVRTTKELFAYADKQLSELTDEEKDNIISADVLDAWFPPAPKIQEVIQSYLPWIIKTSPPTNTEGFIKKIPRNIIFRSHGGEMGNDNKARLNRMSF